MPIDLFRLAALIERAPSAVRVMGALRQAQQGDPEAIAYLMREGWKDALGIYNPRLRTAAEMAVPKGREAWQLFRQALRGNVIDGSAEEVLPWSDIVRHLKAETHGAHVIVGPTGSGKTNLALRLAEIWQNRFQRPVYVISGYPEDIPDWAERTSMRQLLHWVERLASYLEPEENSEGKELEEKRSKAGQKPATEAEIRAMSGKIIVIDEASMSMGGISSVGKQTARDVAAYAMTQCRHVRWHVVYVGQLLRHIREDLRSNAVLFVKHPSGQEMLNDRSDDIFIKRTWEAATEAFRGLRSSPYYQDYPDVRAWSWVRAPLLGGHGTDGVLMPCGQVGDPIDDMAEADGETFEEAEDGK